MSALFTPPRYAPMSGNGTSYPGAKLYFYVTGTTTFKNTYSDADLDPAHVNANPVVADANGLFGVIYLASGDYKVILKDSSDNVLWTVDPQSGLGAADTLTTRGDLLTRGASGYSRLAIGTTGYYLASNGTDPYWASPIIPRLEIQGLTYANNASDATNDIDIAVGGAMDATSARMMVLASALTKRLDATWAVGTNQGGLDTGSASDTDYFIWLINRSDTDVTDVLFSTSATSPTMPTNYNYRRLIGWFRRASSTIVPFKTYETSGGGLEFAWVTIATDVTEAVTTTRSLVSLSRVPSGFSTIANITINANLTGIALNVCCPDQADIAPAFTGGIGVLGDSIGLTVGSQSVSSNTIKTALQVRTDISGRVAMRVSASSTTVYASVISFDWVRR